MMLTFDNETSRPATGARPPVGSHMHGWGEPSNYKTQCSAAYDYEPLPSSQATPPGLHGGSCLSPREMRQHSFPSGASLERSEIAQAALDVIAVVVVALLTIATGIGIAVSIFFLLFCRF